MDWCVCCGMGCGTVVRCAMRQSVGCELECGTSCEVQ